MKRTGSESALNAYIVSSEWVKKRKSGFDLWKSSFGICKSRLEWCRSRFGFWQSDLGFQDYTGLRQFFRVISRFCERV